MRAEASQKPQPVKAQAQPLAQRVDEACDHFEREWMAGNRPSLEGYLADLEGCERVALFRELLAIDLAYRRGRGEKPLPREYLEVYQQHSAVVLEVFDGAPEADGRHRESIERSDDERHSPTISTTRIDLKLTVTKGPHAGRVFVLSTHDTFVVGRGKCAHFKLPLKDRYFSRFHFIIEFNPPDCRLMDLGSTNSTFVNGERVMKADLHDGDIIVGGKTSIMVEIGETVDDDPNPSAETCSGPEGLTLAPLLSLEPPACLEPPCSGVDPVPSASEPGLTKCLVCSRSFEAFEVRLKPVAVDLSIAPICPSCLDKLLSMPQPVEGYGLIRELGRGAMGIVYLAVRLADGALVALKTIHKATGATGRDIARFLREAKILREINHDRIVRFFEIAESRGRIYFVMEYVPGTDAARLLKRKDAPTSLGRFVDWICQALAALEYAHTHQFVHRDIKPSNLLVAGPAGNEVVKLADFGLARVYASSRVSGLTLSSDIGGTIEFMPPEQLTNFREARPTADLYGIGATLYYALTRCHVYDYKARLELKVLQILQDDPIPIRQRLPDLPDGLVQAIDRSLSREPSERFPDARSMRETLEPFR